jgi:2-succinyl-5-enolpyruvyl-6-hydroxy-3-cyclohexene-1-carboxylate synthase
MTRGSTEVRGTPRVRVATGARTLAPGDLEALATTLRHARRGLLVCGPQDDPALPAAVARLATATGYPVLADPLSQVRCGGHDLQFVVDAYDAFLRDAPFVDRHAPDVVLRFGAMPTSKPLLLYLQRHAGCHHVLVDGDGGWQDPAGLASQIVHADGRLLCDALTTLSMVRADPAWTASWQAAGRLARRAISSRLDGLDELFEGKVFAELAGVLPDGALLYAGNSMPVRDLDTFFPAGNRAVRFLANRGANGIDGVVSSALGAAATRRGPLVLVIGDLSFYHDANGLLAARAHGLDATIVLLNNDGGGIFSFLPQAADQEYFERLFGTPHGLDFRPLAETYGAAFTRVARWEEFRAAIQQSITRGKLAVVEVPTDRRRNVTLHRDMWHAVSAALADVPSGDRGPLWGSQPALAQP